MKAPKVAGANMIHLSAYPPELKPIELLFGIFIQGIDTLFSKGATSPCS